MIDRNALAKDMLLYQRHKVRLDEIEQSIKDTILALKETVTTGTVKATYSKGRRTFDYQGTASEKSDDDEYKTVLDGHTTSKTTISIDWRGICKALDIEDVKVKSQSPPSVTLKIVS